MEKKHLYEVADLPGTGRYWFRRGYFDKDYGRERSVIISLEEYNDGNWSIRIEDRKSSQFWQLHKMTIDGEERDVFERFVKGRQGVKNDILSLGYVPTWITNEIKLLASEMKVTKIDEEGRKFLDKLVLDCKKEKDSLREKMTAKVEETSIGGLFKIVSETRGDERGSFREVVRFPEIEVLTGYDFIGKQVNHSYSIYGTLRGLHVEPWAKLVTVISGLAMCVFLDCRPNSKTFGKTETIYLGFGKTPDGQEIKGGAVFVETGIANSFIVLSEKLDYSYVVDDLWTPGTSTYAVNPMDPKLGIPWTSVVPEDKIIRSDRDMKSPLFEEFVKTQKK